MFKATLTHHQAGRLAAPLCQTLGLKLMINKIQISLAAMLIGLGSAIILFWFFLATMSLSSQANSLMPWVATGILIYGYIVVILASIVSFIGIIWAGQVVKTATPEWEKFVLLSIKVGFIIIAVGFIFSIAILFLK